MVTPTRGFHTVLEAVEELPASGQPTLRLLDAYRLQAIPGSRDLVQALEARLLNPATPFGKGGRVRVMVECSDYSGGHGLARDLAAWASSKPAIRVRTELLFFQIIGRDIPRITRDGWRLLFPRRDLAGLLLWITSTNQRRLSLGQGVSLAKDLRLQLEGFRERQPKDADTAENEDLALGLGLLAWSLSVQPRSVGTFPEKVA